MVYEALKECAGAPFDVVAETVKRTAFKVTRMGQLVAREASRRLGVPFGIVDLSLAPTPAVGDSVARISRRSPVVKPLWTRAEKPPMKFTPQVSAARSMASAKGV